MAQECSLEKMSSGSCGAQEEVSQMKAGERRERKCSRKKKEILYRGAVKRRTVGWKKCAADDNHVETGEKKYFNIGGVTVRAPGKAEDVCPPPARRVKIMDNLGPQGSGRKLLVIFGLAIVAIVSNNVTLAEEKSRLNNFIKRRHKKNIGEPLIKYKFLIKCSGATLEKRKKIQKDKIEMA